jgi:hypothetical protein
MIEAGVNPAITFPYQVNYAGAQGAVPMPPGGGCPYGWAAVGS